MAFSFNFWQKWLYYSSLFFVFVGFLVAVFNQSIFFELWNRGAAALFGTNGTLTADVLAFKNFILGPLGGTIAGSYVLLAFIAKYPFKQKEKWAWQAATASLLTWFVIDSSICFYHGAYFNILLINMFTLFVNGLPLLFTKKYFD